MTAAAVKPAQHACAAVGACMARHMLAIATTWTESAAAGARPRRRLFSCGHPGPAVFFVGVVNACYLSA